MKKLIVFLLFLLFTGALRADEGMWVPSLLKQLNAADLKARGLKITVDQIWSTEKPSIKDAIVNFGGGCTAEVISWEGLILTNHHCGYSQIQAHSSLEHDYLKNGFWAMSRAEELPNPGLTASFVIKMEEVTDLLKTTDGTNFLTGNAFLEVAEKLKTDAVTGTHYEATVKPFNYGTRFFLIVTETFKDVRLVGAPPSSIGKFGGDTDNWIWPRHTGDFSIFRIYADKNNKPAEYSAENVPYRPRHSLPISMKGVKPGDFTMVFGFPGRTQQYLSSAAVDFIVNISNPAKIKMRETALNIIDADMRSSDKIRIQYSAKQARISNSYKKWIGETKGLQRLNAVAKKKELEKEYIGLAKKFPGKGEQYAAIPEKFSSLYKSFESYGKASDYFIELIFSGPEFLKYTQGFEKLVEDFKLLETEKKEKDLIEKHKGSIAYYFRNYNPDTDKKLFKAMFPLYLNGTPKELLPDGLDALVKKTKGNWDLYCDLIFEKSFFTSEVRMNELMKNFSAASLKKVKADPAYQLMLVLYEGYRAKVDPTHRKLQGEIEFLMNDYMRGLLALMPDKKYWFDANSTLRLSYGVVEGSRPRDGMNYEYNTTVAGMMEKYVPGDEEFDLPAKLIQLEKNKDYGPYRSGKDMPVCFTASNQTTGGNSGSPVLDANGYLIGINFDRSWESTMSDIMYDPERCRNIILDARYVLFIIDKYAGAGHLLKEMELMTDEHIEEKRKSEVKKAIIDITDKIRTDPDNIFLLVKRAWLFMEINMLPEAQVDVNSAMKLSPKHSDVLFLNGNYLMKRSRFADAVLQFDKVILNGDNAVTNDALKLRADCLMKINRHAEAIPTLTKLISLKSLDAEAYFSRGLCYYITGKSIEACADFMVAEKLGDSGAGLLMKEIGCK